jgi:hypothetical protein
MLFRQLLLRTKVVHVTRKIAAETMFVRKIHAFNIDEIDGRSHRRKKTLMTRLSFCEFGICARKSFSYNIDEIDPSSLTLPVSSAVSVAVVVVVVNVARILQTLTSRLNFWTGKGNVLERKRRPPSKWAT